MISNRTPGAALGAAWLVALLAACMEPARADELCGPMHAQYVQGVAAGMQPFASKVTSTGSFAIKEEYPGNGTEIFVLSFVDRGKTLFVHRVRDDVQSTATTMRPGRTKGGEPGIAVALVQGSVATCEYGAFVRDGQFVVLPRRPRR